MLDVPIDLFRFDDGRIIEVPWESWQKRAIPLRPAEPIIPGEYVMNDVRFAIRHETENARYIGTIAASPVVSIHRAREVLLRAAVPMLANAPFKDEA